MLAHLLAATLAAAPAFAADSDKPSMVGPQACQTCHQAEFAVWEGTKHAQSFRSVHKNPLAKEILAAVGGEANIRKNAVCAQCHFTQEPGEDGTPVAKSAVSCERCHGPASKWIKIHNDYGGAGVTKASESAAHKAQRLAAAKAAGHLRSDMKLEIAQNCMSCHGLAREGVDAETFAKMLKAGHPVNLEFELVRYSQGTVRHRFFPPAPTVNAESTPAELSRLYALGQAAKLLSASKAAAAAPEGDYRKTQLQRAEDAKKALAALKDLPEAATLAASPSEENARALAAALADKDLSAQVALAAKDSYK